MRKLGCFFGTFNPVHNGHLAIANLALEYVDAVLFIPAFKSPDKVVDTEDVGYAYRVSMLYKAIHTPTGPAWENRDGRFTPRFIVLDVEDSLPLPNRTYQTLKRIEEWYPDSELYPIIGSDNAVNIHTWWNWEALVSEYKFIVARRNGISLHHLSVGEEIPIDFGISSTQLRKLIRTKGPNAVKYLTPQEVVNYIETNHLYELVKSLETASE